MHAPSRSTDPALSPCSACPCRRFCQLLATCLHGVGEAFTRNAAGPRLGQSRWWRSRLETSQAVPFPARARRSCERELRARAPGPQPHRSQDPSVLPREHTARELEAKGRSRARPCTTQAMAEAHQLNPLQGCVTNRCRAATPRRSISILGIAECSPRLQRHPYAGSDLRLPNWSHSASWSAAPIRPAPSPAYPLE
jgi:hypothetical protein